MFVSPETRPLRLDKVKRPAGVFEFDAQLVEEDAFGLWVSYPMGSAWRAPHDAGVMPSDAVLLLNTGEPFVTWWIDDPCDRRIEIDVCLPPTATDVGWSFIDLELDPVRHENTGDVEVEDRDEFEEACESGWITLEEATIALTASQRMTQALSKRTEPWGDEGWRRLSRLKSEKSFIKS